jgi:hypothetical protein
MTDTIVKVGAKVSEAHAENSKVTAELIEVMKAPKVLDRDGEGRVNRMTLEL